MDGAGSLAGSLEGGNGALEAPAGPVVVDAELGADLDDLVVVHDAALDEVTVDRVEAVEARLRERELARLVAGVGELFFGGGVVAGREVEGVGVGLGAVKVGVERVEHGAACAGVDEGRELAALGFVVACDAPGGLEADLCEVVGEVWPTDFACEPTGEVVDESGDCDQLRQSELFGRVGGVSRHGVPHGHAVA